MPLTLSRQVGERIIVSVGKDTTIIIDVVRIQEGSVRLSFQAPLHISIDREEIYWQKRNHGQIS